MIYTVTLNTAVDRIIQLRDPLTRKQNNRIASSRYDVGGKGTHVSLVLSALGVANLATGFVGAERCDRLISLLEARGVPCRFVAQPGAATREALVILDGVGVGSYMLTEPGFVIAPESYRALAERLGDLVRPGDWVVFAGSLPVGMTVPQYRALLQQVRARGAELVVDAAGPCLEAALPLAPRLIKPNEAEFQQLVGRPLTGLADYLTEIRRLVDRGVGVVVVSRGKQGSLVGTREGCWRVLAPPVPEVNDTGCGDALVGGLVGYLALGRSLAEALRFATALSAAKATHVESSAVDLEEARRLEPQVIIESVGGESCALH